MEKQLLNRIENPVALNAIMEKGNVVKALTMELVDAGFSFPEIREYFNTLINTADTRSIKRA